ncbi:hypothetical protein B0O80DRAFT_463821 [Mortierella sp. GBAus27b]|nr:hypothetical protein BGX31_010234 [Mortierella sp. GBA43]KAI8348145.1 hypothetical protein B0O80DRAFT_463821 [Mortierella sp. GBAus27b]
MHSPHPLDLPEILSHVARYVHEKSLPSCARVSKAWYRAFIPLVWEDIKVIHRGQVVPKAIWSHSHLVKRLKFGNRSIVNTSLRCPNLELLDFGRDLWADRVTELIISHPSITSLKLTRSKSGRELGIWTQLLEFRHLKALRLYCIEIGERDTDAFWQLCTRLERMQIMRLWVKLSSLSSMEFPNIKDLEWENVDRRHVDFSIEFMKRCPGITSLRCCSWPEFIPLLAANTWPNLHSLTVYSTTNSISEEDLIKILGSMQRITRLNLNCCPSDFTPAATALLHQHFASLREIRLIWNTGSSTLSMAQEILSSCPLLECLVAPQINASVIAKGRPWVCLGLRKLSLSIAFDPSTNHLVQPIVIDQILRLKWLVELCIWNLSDAIADFLRAIDLRLENGLGKLSTLRALEQLDWGKTTQRMCDQEIDWMLEHWKCLDKVCGHRFNAIDDNGNKRHAAKMLEHGIGVITSV